MPGDVTQRPLNGIKTHPLSAHALAELRALAHNPEPTSVVNPGVVNRLTREGLAEIVDLQSPFKTHRGRNTPHLRITDAGRARLTEETPHGS